MNPAANPPSAKKPLIAIVGSTASGKTSLAVKLAKHFNGEIISVDSRQVYQGLDIGTGKEGEPTTINLPDIGPQPARLINNIPQYMVDLVPPTQTFTVSQFQELAYRVIKSIEQMGKLPLLVGGSHLYINVLTQGYVIPPSTPAELALRQKLEALPTDELRNQLKQVDLISYNNINPQNRRRLIRALALSITLDQPFSQQQKKVQIPWRIIYLAINLPRQELYKNIDRRVDDRLKIGMIEEVRHLLDSGVPKEKLISFGLEYRYITQYLTGAIPSREEMATKLKFATHGFARRQLTWLKHQLPVQWVSSPQEAIILIEHFLEN